MRNGVERQSIEPPCIWALAGVLAYRPCDRGFDCDSCELFHALRGGGRPAVADRSPSRSVTVGPEVPTREDVIDGMVNGQLARLLIGCELHLDRAYSPSHLWIKRVEPELVELGLDLNTLKVLDPIDDITLPHVGVLLKLDEPCGWITRGRMAISLAAPLTGEIEAVNDDHVGGLRRRETPLDEEFWLLRVRSRDDIDDIPGLYRGERALRWYLAKIELIKRSLHKVMLSTSIVGSTQADGGAMHADLQDVLGQTAFEALVGELFHVQV